MEGWLVVWEVGMEVDWLDKGFVDRGFWGFLGVVVLFSRWFFGFLMVRHCFETGVSMDVG